MRPYLRAANVYICPMRDGGGTRLKILDALAMGKPIVSTTLGCEGIRVEPGRNVLLADTPTEFVAQIRRVFEDGDLRETLAAEGRRLVEAQYAWHVVGDGLEHVYRSIGVSARQRREQELAS